MLVCSGSLIWYILFFFYAFHKWIFLPRRNEAEIFNLLDKYLSCSSIEALWEYININFQMYMECSGVQCANVNGLNKHNGVLMENSDYKVNQRRRLCWAVPLLFECSEVLIPMGLQLPARGEWLKNFMSRVKPKPSTSLGLEPWASLFCGNFSSLL